MMKLLKGLLIIAGLAIVSAPSEAALPIRYVQISTNSITQQPGAINISTEAVNVSTVAVSFLPPVYSSMTIQLVQNTVTASSATTAIIYAHSNLAATITPRFATSRIRITVSTSMFSNTSIVRSCFGTIYRDTTDIGGGTGGGFAMLGNSSTATPLEAPFSIPGYIDNPGTTSAITYTFDFKTSNATNACFINNSATKSFITLEELR